MRLSASTSRFRSLLAMLLLRSPFWKRSVWHRAGRQALRFTYAYLGVLIVLLALENYFLFHPLPHTEDWLTPPAGLDVEDVELVSAAGLHLHGWWARPDGWRPEQGAILYFHGNAGNLSGRGEAVKVWRDNLHLAVLIVDYPGYGKSQGRPTEASCYAAGDTAYDWVTQNARVPAERLILFGGSLGGAIATDLATRRPYRALVLVSTFTSFPDMAQKTFPWLPARWLVRNKLDNLSKVATLTRPIFIAHGTADTLVPIQHAERLFAAANQPKRYFVMPGQFHDELPTPDCFKALRVFLKETDTSVAPVDLLPLENSFLFHPLPHTEEWILPPAGLHVLDVELVSAAGLRLHGWWAKPDGWRPKQGAILYFHGNAGNLSGRGEAVKVWRDNLHLAVLIVDYTGYGKSQGRPTEASCYAVGDTAYDWVTQNARVPAERLILFGGSLGGAIATDLATRRPYRALVLVSTFTSFPDMAQKTFPWLPARWLVRNKLDNLSKVATLTRPIFIAHGTADTLVPIQHAERLFAAANEPKRYFVMPGQFHDELPTPDCFKALRVFLKETDTPAAQPN